MRVKPKFQYWLMDTEDEIFDWKAKERADRGEKIPEEAYCKKFRIARTFLKVQDVTPNVIARMSKYFNDLTIKHYESFKVDDISTFQHPMLVNFQNQTTLDRI